MTSSLGVCQFCGRQNEAAAHFCSDCGKPLTKAAASRAAVGAGGAAAGIGARTTDPSHQHSPAHGTVAPDAPCPVCGSVPARTAGGGGRDSHDRRSIPDRRADYSLTLILVSETATEVARFERKQSTTAIGRTEGDIRFPEDQFLSPLHAKLTWEEGRLEVRDLGSRNGTWVFLEAPHRLTDGDLILIGSQVLRFRRLGYPGPHTSEADATKRMGSVTPSADIASLTQLRGDGSGRDIIQLSPGRDIHIGRERGDWIFPYDPSMSAQHATVRSEDADFVLVDDHSRNGIAIAARGAMPVHHGSRIMVGDKLLRVELPEAARAPAT
ncbi:MAG TPA: FHA domain-containing protein [Gemmatimonadales bacterium]|nr:FHA domain-containing protein [Gemmatimonadales bacterium]